MSEQYKKSNGIYVDLDSLMDTRIAILKLLNPDLTFKILKDEHYYSRVTNEFSEFGEGEFEKKWQSRGEDKKIIMSSPPTNIIFIIKEIVDVIVDTMDYNPLYNRITVYLNVYPYKVNKDEAESFKQVIKTILKNNVDVKILNTKTENLSLLWVSQKLEQMFLYEYDRWLNSIGKDISKTPLTKLSLFTPMVYFGHEPDEQEQEEIRKFAEKCGALPNHFSVISEYYRLLIDINFIPNDNYCLANTYKEYS